MIAPFAAKAPSRLRLDAERALAGLSWDEVFGRLGPIEIEVGNGKGRFLLAAAQARPDVLHFGIEWANEYLSIAEERAEKRGLENVRFVRVDAKDLIARAIPSESVRAYYVFYPDPWPKKRHNKRRFFNEATLGHVARTLARGGELHVATDHDEYWSVIEPLVDRHPELERLPSFGGASFPLDPAQPLTNFEAKYEIQGRNRHRASWRRR